MIRRWLPVFAILAIVALVIGLFGGTLVRAGVALAIDAATGDRVAFEALSLGGGRLDARGVTVTNAAGEPLLAAARVQATYDLGALASGARRYGLISVAIDRPRLHLIRHADGSFNVPAGGASGGGGSGRSSGGTPLRLAVALHDGSVTLSDPYRRIAIARELSLNGLELAASLDTAAHSSYVLTGAVGGFREQAFTLRGRFDANGYALHHLTAATIALAPLVDYVINTHAAEVTRGIAHDVDVRAYSFGSSPLRLAGSGLLAHGELHVPGLVVPASEMAGRVDLFDDGIATPHMSARLGPVPVHLAGGLFAWSAPAFRLGIVADGPLRDVRSLFTFSQNLPLGGTAHVETLLESAVGSPLVAIVAHVPHAAYGAFPIENVAGRAFYYDSDIAIASVRARYAGLATSVAGDVALGDVAHPQLVVAATGPADGIPYAAELAPRATVHGTALIAGDGLALDARGVVGGANADTRFRGTFHVDPLGDGTFGPIALERDDGSSAAGTFYLDRQESASGFWVDARGVRFAEVARDPHLPGLALAPPIFGGRLDGDVAGYGPPSNFRIAGSARAHDFASAGLHIDDVDTALAGTFANLRLGAVTASGPWGSFRGTGAYAQATAAAPQTLALAGDYRGSFTQLRAFTGDVGAKGAVAGPIALLVTPERTLVQARSDRSPGASVDGVPVDGIAATLAVAQRHVRVYSATARVAGGTFAASGTLDGARGVGVSVAGASARHIAGIAPIGDASVAAIGTYRATRTASQFDGGLAVGGATLERTAVSGNGDVTLAGTHLGVRTGDALVGAAFGTLAGSLTGVGTGAPYYDLGLHVPSAPIEPFARALAPARHDIAGTLAGDLRVRGTPATLGVSGRLAVPEGIVNGLAFSHASFGVAIDPGEFAVRHGAVTIGSTTLGFGGRSAGEDASLQLHSRAADLSDFDDYFDAGDTLGGTGPIDVRFRKRGGAVRTQANLAIARLHYRRFDLGDADAHWTSSGRAVTGTIAFGGPSGRLATTGTLTLPMHAPLERLIERSRFDGTATLRDLDLGVWLPALGYQLPVGGRVDASASIAGALSDPNLVATATLESGTLGKFPVDRLEVDARSTLRRTTITRVTVELPSLSIAGSGSFGIGERDPIAFALHAKSPDVGPIAATLFGTKADLDGAAEADLKIAGTRAVPQVIGGFDLEQATVHGVAVPLALGELSVKGRDIVLSSTEVSFSKGTLQLAGSVPLQVAPFGFGPADAPIALDLRATGVRLDDFAPLLPEGSTLEGTLDGHVAIGGTAGNPRIDGSLALGQGSLRAPFETIPLTAIGGRLHVTDNVAILDTLHAEAGGGTLDADGTIALASLVRPGTGTAYRLEARAKNLSLDVPSFVTGQVDGVATLTHQPHELPSLGAKLSLADAIIPFSALLVADGSGSGAFDASTLGTGPAATVAAVAGTGNDVALALDLSATRNVRVRSANVDIGARGELAVTGTRSRPQLDGQFVSTGGTISYFNTVFRLIDGTVTFRPDLGVIPNLDADAVAHVLDPDPNAVRNVTGSADVTLNVKGQVTAPVISLSSNPPYDRQQILGLLLSAPALGASNLFGDTRGQAALYGSVPATTTAPTIAGQRASSTEVDIAQEAFGVANAQFTRTLLSPIENTVASAIGLSNLNVNVDYTGSVGLTARKVLGKQINAIYGTSFGYPYRQTFGFEIKPGPTTAAQVTVFQTLGAYGVDQLTPTTTTYLNTATSRLSAAQPFEGTAGFSISLQKLLP